MITDWKYIKIPDHVDTSRPLMPLRDGYDDEICGIDPAWLYEVLSAWIMTPVPQSKSEMPDGPTAAWNNAIYMMCRQIKSIGGFVDANGNHVEFGDVHADVESGDEVLRTDLSDVFDFIKDVRGRAFSDLVFQSVSLSHATSTFHEGVYDYLPDIPAPSGSEILKWEWTYFWTDGRLQDRNGGAWRRDVASNFTVPVPISGVHAEFFDGGTAEIEVVASDGETNHRGYVQGATVSEVSDGAVVLSVDAASVIAAANAKFGVSEKPYKTGMESTTVEGHTVTTGSGHLSIAATMRARLVLNFAQDYRHP